MNNTEIRKTLDEVGKKFEELLPHVEPDYANGYLQAVRDCKVPFYGEDDENTEAKSVVYGKWKGEPNLFTFVYKCSVCGFVTPLGKARFCPFCGANMREEKVEDNE